MPIPSLFDVEEVASATNHVPVEERFWAKVNKTESCWLWTGATVGDAGTIWLNGGNYVAARLSWELHNGPIPDGLFVCHNCPGGDNPRCVNPGHLFLGTHTENLRDASKKGMLSTAKDGESNPRSILTEQNVLEIRRRYKHRARYPDPNSSLALAEEFGISMAWARAIAKGKHWTHLK